MSFGQGLNDGGGFTPKPPTISGDLSNVSPSLLKAHMQRDLGRFIHSSLGTHTIPNAAVSALAANVTAVQAANHQALLAAVNASLSSSQSGVLLRGGSTSGRGSDGAPTSGGAQGSSSSSSPSGIATLSNPSTAAIVGNVTNITNNPNSNFYGLVGVPGVGGGAQQTVTAAANGKATPAAVALANTYSPAHDILSNHSTLFYKLKFASSHQTEMFRKVCNFLASATTNDGERSFEPEPSPNVVVINTKKKMSSGEKQKAEDLNPSATPTPASGQPTTATSSTAPRAAGSALADYKARAASLIHRNNAMAVEANAPKEGLASLPSGGKVVLRRTESIEDYILHTYVDAHKKSKKEKKKIARATEKHYRDPTNEMENNNGLVASPPTTPRGDEVQASELTNRDVKKVEEEELEKKNKKETALNAMLSEAADRLLAYFVVTTPSLSSQIDNGNAATGLGSNSSGQAATSADLAATNTSSLSSSAQILSTITSSPPIIRICQCYPQLFTLLKDKAQWAFYQQLLRDASDNANVIGVTTNPRIPTTTHGMVDDSNSKKMNTNTSGPASPTTQRAPSSLATHSTAYAYSASAAKRVSEASSPVAVAPSSSSAFPFPSSQTSAAANPIAAGPAAGSSVALLPASAWLSLWLDLHHTEAALTRAKPSLTGESQGGNKVTDQHDGRSDLTTTTVPSIASWTPMHKTRVAVRTFSGDSSAPSASSPSRVSELSYAAPASQTATGPLVPKTSAPLLAAHIPLDAVTTIVIASEKAPDSKVKAARGLSYGEQKEKNNAEDNEEDGESHQQEEEEDMFRVRLAKLYREIVPQMQLLAAASALPSPLSGSAVARTILTEPSHCNGSSNFIREIVLGGGVGGRSLHPQHDERTLKNNGTDNNSNNDNTNNHCKSNSTPYFMYAASVAATLTDAEKVRLFFAQLYDNTDEGQPCEKEKRRKAREGEAPDGEERAIASTRPVVSSTNATLADFLLFTTLISPILTHRKADACRGHSALRPLLTLERVEKEAFWRQLSHITDALFSEHKPYIDDDRSNSDGDGEGDEEERERDEQEEEKKNEKEREFTRDSNRQKRESSLPALAGGSRLLSRLSTLNSANDETLLSSTNEGEGKGKGKDDDEQKSKKSNTKNKNKATKLLNSVLSSTPGFIQDAPSTFIEKIRQRAAVTTALLSTADNDESGERDQDPEEASPASPLASADDKKKAKSARRASSSTLTPHPRFPTSTIGTTINSNSNDPIPHVATTVVPCKFHEHYSLDNALMTCLWGLEELVTVNVLQDHTYDAKLVAVSSPSININKNDNKNKSKNESIKAPNKNIAGNGNVANTPTDPNYVAAIISASSAERVSAPVPSLSNSALELSGEPSTGSVPTPPVLLSSTSPSAASPAHCLLVGSNRQTTCDAETEENIERNEEGTGNTTAVASTNDNDNAEEQYDEASPSPSRGFHSLRPRGGGAEVEESIVPNSALASQAASPERVHLRHISRRHTNPQPNNKNTVIESSETADDGEEAGAAVEDGDLEVGILTATGPTVHQLLLGSSPSGLHDHQAEHALDDHMKGERDDDHGVDEIENDDHRDETAAAAAADALDSGRDLSSRRAFSEVDQHHPSFSSGPTSSAAFAASSAVFFSKSADKFDTNDNNEGEDNNCNISTHKKSDPDQNEQQPISLLVVPPTYPSLPFPAKTPASVSSVYANIIMSVIMLCGSRTRSHPTLDGLAYTDRVVTVGGTVARNNSTGGENDNNETSIGGGKNNAMPRPPPLVMMSKFTSSAALTSALKCLAASVVNLRHLTLRNNEAVALWERAKGGRGVQVTACSPPLTFIDSILSLIPSSSVPQDLSSLIKKMNLLTSGGLGAGGQKLLPLFSATYKTNDKKYNKVAGGEIPTVIPHNPMRDLNTLLALYDLMATSGTGRGVSSSFLTSTNTSCNPPLSQGGDRDTLLEEEEKGNKTSLTATNHKKEKVEQQSVFTPVLIPRPLPTISMTLPLSFATTQTLLQWQFQSFVLHPTPVTAAALLHVLAREGEAVMNVMVNGTVLANSSDPFTGNFNAQSIVGNSYSSLLSKRPAGYTDYLFSGGNAGTGSTHGGSSSSSGDSAGAGSAAQQMPIGDALIIAASRVLQIALTISTSDTTRDTTLSGSALLYAPKLAWPLYAQLILAAVRLVAARNAFIRRPHWCHPNSFAFALSATSGDSKRKSNSSSQQSSGPCVTPVPHLSLTGAISGPAGMHRDAQKSLGLLLLSLMRLYVNEDPEDEKDLLNSVNNNDAASASSSFAKKEGFSSTYELMKALQSVAIGNEEDFDCYKTQKEGEGEEEGGGEDEEIEAHAGMSCNGSSYNNASFAPFANETFFAGSLSSANKLLLNSCGMAKAAPPPLSSPRPEEHDGNYLSFSANRAFHAVSPALPPSSSYRIRKRKHMREMEEKQRKSDDPAMQKQGLPQQQAQRTTTSLRWLLNRYRHRTPVSSTLRILMRAAEEAIRDGANPQIAETMQTTAEEEESLAAAAEARAPSHLDAQQEQRYNFNKVSGSAAAKGGKGENGGDGPEPRKRGFGEAGIPSDLISTKSANNRTGGSGGGSSSSHPPAALLAPAECPEVLRQTLVAAIRMGPMLVGANNNNNNNNAAATTAASSSGAAQSSASVAPSPSSSPRRGYNKNNDGSNLEKRPSSLAVSTNNNYDIAHSQQRGAVQQQPQQQQQQQQRVSFSSYSSAPPPPAPFDGEEMNLFRLVERKDGGAFVNADIIETLEAAACVGMVNNNATTPPPTSTLPPPQSALVKDSEEEKRARSSRLSGSSQVIFPSHLTNVRKSHLGVLLAGTPTLGASLARALPSSGDPIPLFDPRDEPSSYRDMEDNIFAVASATTASSTSAASHPMLLHDILGMGSGKTANAVTNYFAHILRSEQQRGGGSAGGVNDDAGGVELVCRKDMFDFDDEEDTADRVHLAELAGAVNFNHCCALAQRRLGEGHAKTLRKEKEGHLPSPLSTAAAANDNLRVSVVAPNPLLPASSLAALVASSRCLGGGNLSANARVPSHFNMALAERYYTSGRTFLSLGTAIIPATSTTAAATAKTQPSSSASSNEEGDLLALSIANLKPKFLAASYGMPPTHTAWAVSLAVKALKQRANLVHNGVGSLSSCNKQRNEDDSHGVVINHSMRHYGEFVTHL